MRALNYGTGFPVTPYGLAWRRRENAPAILAGLGTSEALPPDPLLVPQALSERYNRAAARRDVFAQAGKAFGYGGPRKFVFVDGERVRLRKAVRGQLRAKRKSVNALAGLGFTMVPSPSRGVAFPTGSLSWSKSLRVTGNPRPRGRFGISRVSDLRRRFDSWEKYQGLSGHPTLSSVNPRYAAWRGRMYAGLAGEEVSLTSVLGQFANVGSQLLIGNLNKKTQDAQNKAAQKAAQTQARMLAAQAQAAQAEADAARAGTTKTILYVVGGVAAALALGLALRKKR